MASEDVVVGVVRPASVALGQSGLTVRLNADEPDECVVEDVTGAGWAAQQQVRVGDRLVMVNDACSMADKLQQLQQPTGVQLDMYVARRQGA
jgi:C-terminal processing protease CtpA/Prc